MQRYKPSSKIIHSVTGEVGLELEPTVIAWDGGNGTSSVWHVANARLEHFALPNCRVPVTGYRMNNAVTTIGQNDMIYADVNTGRFGIGSGIWEQSKYPPETFANTPDRYGSEIHIFMLLCLLAAINAPEETPLTIVTSAPPGIVNQVAKTIKRNLMNGEAGDKSGEWAIRMSYDKKPRTFIINKVVVVPEGIGAFSAYAFDVYGDDVMIPSPNNASDDLLAGSVHIHDAGLGTYDTYVVRNGQIDAESMGFATDSDGGILRQMIEPALDKMRDMFLRRGETMPNIKAVQMDNWLLEWSARRMRQSAAQIKINGNILDLQDLFAQCAGRYARYAIEEKLSRSIQQGADTILLAGGGWEYSLPHILKQYRDMNLLYPKIVEHLKGIPMWELNAYGALPMVACNKKLARRV